MFVNVGITESINPKSLANLFNIRPERKQSMAESSMRIELRDTEIQMESLKSAADKTLTKKYKVMKTIHSTSKQTSINSIHVSLPTGFESKKWVLAPITTWNMLL